jgi:hypothetical protein
MHYSGLMKAFVIVGLVVVVLALASAGVFMLKRPGSEVQGQGEADRRMAWALAVRVGASVCLFLLVLLAWHFGWIKPGGLPMGR